MITVLVKARADLFCTLARVGMGKNLTGCRKKNYCSQAEEDKRTHAHEVCTVRVYTQLWCVVIFLKSQSIKIYFQTQRYRFMVYNPKEIEASHDSIHSHKY